ncbi:hypothetical protein [Bacillus sp. USDA818B3_A]|uniref:hypothetical protein n=1 Tax=Bacillus sp. USDA818B3_A TaxID=2698834 RepID=UPI0013705A33|nr:hypothetical protein [Bacillus sp. USDA818B3_A]
MKTENNSGGNQMKYSIWNTRTEENIDITKERIAEAMVETSLKTKSTEQPD